jgi:hypothetical protein
VALKRGSAVEYAAASKKKKIEAEYEALASKGK